MKNTDTFVRVPMLGRGIDPAPDWTRSDFLLVSALTLVGLALRIPGLNQGMWLDELWTLFGWVRSPAAEIISAVGYSNNHVFYSLCAHFAVSWLGESAWTLRLPALLFGVAAIPALYQLGRQVASREEAFLVALFMALNYQFVWYSQNARGYTGLLLGAVLSSILFIRLLAAARPRVGLILGYAVLAALTAWIHLTAVFVIFVHGLVWLVLAGRPNRGGQRAAVMPTFMALLLTGLFILALYAPSFGADHNDFRNVGDGTSGFVADWEDDTGRVLSAATTWVLREYAQGLQRSIPGGWPVVTIVVVMLLTGMVSYLRQGVVVAALLLLPVVTTVLVVYSRGQLLFPRFMFGSAGFLMLLAVRGGFVSAGSCFPFLSRRQVLLIGSLVALAGATLVPAAWKPKQDFIAVAEYMAQHRSPDDAVICLIGMHF
ncbi:MAG TPA: glycosyltransferase family 39 protein, partial [Xanthomonadales bacterium]|nr:glycosyltransferase family 39 protein [Xanthomonadales bacterium]